MVARDFVDSVAMCRKKFFEILIKSRFCRIRFFDFTVQSAAINAMSTNKVATREHNFKFFDVFFDATIFARVGIFGCGSDEATDGTIIVAVNWNVEAIYGENFVEFF